MLLFWRCDICYIDAISYIFHKFFLIWGIFLVVLMEIQVFWDVKLYQLVYSLEACCVSDFRVKQSKYYWFYVTLKMGSLHSSESSLSVYQLTLCVTSHNIWILFIFILIFWIDYRSVILKTYYIDTSQFEGKNIKYLSLSMCINVSYLHLVFLFYIHGGKL
jgi:hypothetical protein